MSYTAVLEEVGGFEFKWLKKRGVGGKKKEIQFYESFMYDGVEYTLYDCVYMYKEGLPEPCVGKLIKIWEHADKTKKVKVHWFFHAREISKWLQGNKAHENEIFLASGEGVGLANVNPLEAVAGKCNVICVSKDRRNPQPSEEDLKSADYVFYRTFDVQHCTILDRIDDNIGGLETNYIYNRNGSENASNTPNLFTEGSKNVDTCNEMLPLSDQSMPEEPKASKKDQTVKRLRVNVDVKDSLPTDTKEVLIRRDSPASVQPVSRAGVELSKAAAAIEMKRTLGSKVNHVKDENKLVKAPLKRVENKVKLKSPRDSKVFEDRPLKKFKADDTERVGGEERLPPNGKDVIAKTLPYEDMALKNAKEDSAAGLNQKKSEDNVQKLRTNDITGRDSADKHEEKHKTKLGLESVWMNKEPREQQDEKIKKPLNGKLARVSGSELEDEETAYREFEVTRRPDANRSKWFRPRPWEDRVREAQGEGTLLLLENLDPGCTSGEVEDVVWHAFKETCTAKMVQHTAISSPQSGQALIILKTKEASERVIRKMDAGCLMMSNGRPAVASIVPHPDSSAEQSTFFGHLALERFRLQTQREMRVAVSTTHFSQPNTVEFEMAMEWCLLQSRSEIWWNKLYKQQREELKKLHANLKRK